MDAAGQKRAKKERKERSASSLFFGRVPRRGREGGKRSPLSIRGQGKKKKKGGLMTQWPAMKRRKGRKTTASNTRRCPQTASEGKGKKGRKNEGLFSPLHREAEGEGKAEPPIATNPSIPRTRKREGSQKKRKKKRRFSSPRWPSKRVGEIALRRLRPPAEEGKKKEGRGGCCILLP